MVRETVDEREMSGAMFRPSPKSNREQHLQAVQNIADQLFNWVDFNDKDFIGNGLLGAYVPGALPGIAPDGMAVRVPKGTQLLLELHYTPNGRKTEDRPSVGFLYMKEKPKHEIRDRSILNVEFLIPPFAENHQVKATTTFDKELRDKGIALTKQARGR